MRHNPGFLRLISTLTAAATLSACSLMPTQTPPPTATPVERIDPSLTLIGNHLKMMTRLNQGSPTEQAEIFQAAKDAAQFTPTTQHRLAYALALATPGHGATNAEAARQQLAGLVGAPENLLPAEKALAQVILLNVEQRLVLQTENKRLQEEAARLARERASANGRRLQAEVDENARLRKELAEAQAKLDEIARIERSITERKPPQTPPKK